MYENVFKLQKCIQNAQNVFKYTGMLAKYKNVFNMN